MNVHFSLECALCAGTIAGLEAIECPNCGGPAVIRYAALPGQAYTSEERGLWHYRPWLPIDESDRAITLGEGGTPLVRLSRWSERVGLEQLYAKLEFAGPTGSFKDRGASVLVSRALATGATDLIEDSSGNAGAAMAAYAARAGMACTVFVPASAPAGKLLQIRAFGARLVSVDGSRADVAEAALLAGHEPGAYYAGHNTNPYFVEGTKTFAFELIEAFGMRAPDHVVMPVGGGSLLWGTALGAAQWRDAGLCLGIPRLHAVQATGCMPLAAAFAEGADRPLAVERHPTVAGGITIERPARGPLILKSIRASGGSVVAVTDEEILQAQRDLAALEGIFMEPTSAAAFAGLQRIVASGRIRPGDTVVVAVTGSGLKDIETVARGMAA